MILDQIARTIDARVFGDSSLNINMISPLNDPIEGNIAFAENEKALNLLLASKISAIIIPDSLSIPETNKTVVQVENGKLAFIKVLQLFENNNKIIDKIHQTAIIHPDAIINQPLTIMANVVIEKGVILEENVQIYPFVYIGENCHIKKNTIIHSHAAIEKDSIIGEYNIIHNGAIIGADGFGYYDAGRLRYKIPQLGIVETESYVEIGANSTIDRATLGKTKIGSGTKIDNLVQIAHNCTIGKNCFITSQVGIAGSSSIGDRVTLAGQAGVSDHITIGDDVIVLAQSCVTKDIKNNQIVMGFPAKNARVTKREIAYLSRMTKKT